MRVVLTERFRVEELEKMKNFKEGLAAKYSIETGEAIVKKFIVLQLVKRNIQYAVYNLGAGVCRISTDTTICTKCNGTGRMPRKEAE